MTNPLSEKLKSYEVILGSQSPRRKALLEGLDIDFQTLPLNADESFPPNLKNQEITEFLCQKKAEAFNFWKENTLLITSDTIVVLDGNVLEKPKNEEDAQKMLQQLSGKTHSVFTSVGLFLKDKNHIFSDETKVTFKNLEQQEIEYYVEKYKPFDKAGAYGVQEWIGYVAVEHLDGSYFTVMGLPIDKIYKELIRF